MPQPRKHLRAVPTNLASVLRAERARKGLTQAEVARRLGTTATTIGNWEAGRPPQKRFHPKLVRYLGLAGLDELRSLVVPDRVDLPPDKPNSGGEDGVHPTSVDAAKLGALVRLPLESHVPADSIAVEQDVPDGIDPRRVVSAYLDQVVRRSGRLREDEARLLLAIFEDGVAGQGGR